jgi:hypothetical protein
MIHIWGLSASTGHESATVDIYAFLSDSSFILFLQHSNFVSFWNLNSVKSIGLLKCEYFIRICFQFFSSAVNWMS